VRDVDPWRSHGWGTGGPHLSRLAVGGRCALREGVSTRDHRTGRSGRLPPRLCWRFNLASYIGESRFCREISVRKSWNLSI